MANIRAKTKIAVFALLGILCMILASCDPQVQKQGEYWVIDWVDPTKPVMFKGTRLGSIGCGGLEAYRTLEGNWIIASKGG